MLVPGLVSITFRQLSAEEIIELVRKSGLDVIEWGGDVHVPHGDIPRAEEVGRLTRDAGIATPTYGSYYRIYPEGPEEEFGRVLDTAIALGASLIRVWVGRQAYLKCSEDERKTIVDHCRKIADAACEKGISIASEFHGNSVTEEKDSAMAFFEELNHDNFFSYWQCPGGLSEEDLVMSLKGMLPYLRALHVFSWSRDGKRLPLAECRDRWSSLLEVVRDSASEADLPAMIEFVRDGEPASYLDDAEALKEWLKEMSQEP